MLTAVTLAPLLILSDNHPPTGLTSAPTADLYTQVPGIVPGADQFCGLGPVNFFVDPYIPPVGKAVFYLVSGSDGITEFDLGTDSTGAFRPNTIPCGP